MIGEGSGYVAVNVVENNEVSSTYTLQHVKDYDQQENINILFHLLTNKKIIF